tara:strand:- start:20 stop:235 length:216 start_codon:yes stop_codon:yes gene_type:complete
MKTISIKWSTYDVLGLADEMGIKLTDQEADEILDQMERFHDAQIGINWGVIEIYIEQHQEEKKSLLNKQLN